MRILVNIGIMDNGRANEKKGFGVISMSYTDETYG